MLTEEETEEREYYSPAFNTAKQDQCFRNTGLS